MNIIRVSNNPLALQTVVVFKKTIFKFFLFFAKIEIISVFLSDSFFGLFENILLKNKIGSHQVFTKVKNKNKTLHTVLGFQIWSPNIVINLTWP